MIPIVLHHGIYGFNVLRLGLVRVHYWREIDAAIAGRGHPVIATQVHPTGGVARRAAQLKEYLLSQLRQRRLADQRVVIIAHSMGGMDARYMISRLGMAERVAALVTIACAHRGTSYYDWMTRQDAFGVLRAIHRSVVDIQALWDATTQRATQLSAELPDMPGVRYFSVTAVCPPERIPIWLARSYGIVSEAEGPNDGMVSQASARWGEELDCWPFHHFHLINWPMPTLPTDSIESVTPYYLRLLDRLELEGVLGGEPALVGTA